MNIEGAVNVTEEKKERAISVLPTIKSLKNAIKRLDEGKMIIPKEKEVLDKIHENIVKRWMGLEIDFNE